MRFVEGVGKIKCILMAISSERCFFNVIIRQAIMLNGSPGLTSSPVRATALYCFMSSILLHAISLEVVDCAIR